MTGIFVHFKVILSYFIFVIFSRVVEDYRVLCVIGGDRSATCERLWFLLGARSV